MNNFIKKLVIGIITVVATLVLNEISGKEGGNEEC